MELVPAIPPLAVGVSTSLEQAPNATSKATLEPVPDRIELQRLKDRDRNVFGIVVFQNYLRLGLRSRRAFPHPSPDVFQPVCNPRRWLPTT
jgi:hypothetical protein